MAAAHNIDGTGDANGLTLSQTEEHETEKQNPSRRNWRRPRESPEPNDLPGTCHARHTTQHPPMTYVPLNQFVCPTRLQSKHKPNYLPVKTSCKIWLVPATSRGQILYLVLTITKIV